MEEATVREFVWIPGLGRIPSDEIPKDPDTGKLIVPKEKTEVDTKNLLATPPGKKKKKPVGHLTIEQLRGVMPLSVRKNITDKFVNLVNSAIDDSDERDSFRENILSWSTVMREGKWKLSDYINAVKYVTFKLTGDSMLSSWIKVFPERYQRLVDKGVPDKNISSHVSMYNRNDLVLKVVERTLPVVHILNSDLLQEAINKEAVLMRTARSETVQQKAAATLIEFLKPPESLKVDLNVGVSNDTLEDLRGVTRELAVQQRNMIKNGGMKVQQIAEMPIIKAIEDRVNDEIIEMEPEKISRLNPLSDFYGKKNG